MVIFGGCVCHFGIKYLADAQANHFIPVLIMGDQIVDAIIVGGVVGAVLGYGLNKKKSIYKE